MLTSLEAELVCEWERFDNGQRYRIVMMRKEYDDSQILHGRVVLERAFTDSLGDTCWCEVGVRSKNRARIFDSLAFAMVAGRVSYSSGAVRLQ